MTIKSRTIFPTIRPRSLSDCMDEYLVHDLIYNQEDEVPLIEDYFSTSSLCSPSSIKSSSSDTGTV